MPNAVDLRCCFTPGAQALNNDINLIEVRPSIDIARWWIAGIPARYCAFTARQRIVAALWALRRFPEGKLTCPDTSV